VCPADGVPAEVCAAAGAVSAGARRPPPAFGATPAAIASALPAATPPVPLAEVVVFARRARGRGATGRGEPATGAAAAATCEPVPPVTRCCVGAVATAGVACDAPG
jgi:hypothetical protein